MKSVYMNVSLIKSDGKKSPQYVTVQKKINGTHFPLEPRSHSSHYMIMFESTDCATKALWLLDKQEIKLISQHKLLLEVNSTPALDPGVQPRKAIRHHVTLNMTNMASTAPCCGDASLQRPLGAL